MIWASDRFARAGRPKKNQRLDASASMARRQQLAGAEECGLASELVEAAWSHARGQRLMAGSFRRSPKRAAWIQPGLQTKSSRAMEGD